MTCFECGHDRLVPGEVCLTGTRHNEQFAVHLAGLRCENCGFQTIDNEQSAGFTQLVSDEYRRAHGLLVGAEIRSRRSQLGMSQQEFSEYLGVGIASVKRWESGQIQDKAMDELMRLKTDLVAARQNLKTLEVNVPEQYVLTTVLMGNQNVDLAFLLDRQGFDVQIPMNLDRSSIADCEHISDLCLAA